MGHTRCTPVALSYKGTEGGLLHPLLWVLRGEKGGQS